MFKYFLKRVVAFIPKIIIISIIVFLAMEMVPGDPLDYLLSPDQMAELTLDQIEQLRESMGLNKSLPERYLRWAMDVLKGNFGFSLISGTNIKTMIGNRLAATLELSVLGLLIATIVGVSLGFISAIKHNGIIDFINTTFGMLGISMPEFFLGLCGIAIFSLALGWLPTGGRMTVGQEAFFKRLEYLILPVLCLAAHYIATLMRYTRGSMLDVLNKEFIKASRSKGISEFRVNWNHGFRNALLPVMIIIVNRIPLIVSGTVVIEGVFNYPGMGSMLISAISGSDMPVVLMATLLISIMILFSSLLVDLFAMMLDPRIRFE